MGPQFHETNMGRNFFESQFPKLIRELQELNDNLKDNIMCQQRMIEMQSENRTIEITGTTVEELQNLLSQYPRNAVVHVCGCKKVYIHQFGQNISFDETECIE